jgi:nucleoside-diphosphate-sugar epimerase
MLAGGHHLDAGLDRPRRVLEFARSHGVRGFLFTSSRAFCCKQSAVTRIPEDYAGAPSTIGPASACGQVKRVSEFMMTAISNDYAFDRVFARQVLGGPVENSMFGGATW